jgi:hypothetical protein
LFRHLLLQIGGANIENPPISSNSSPLGLVLASLARFGGRSQRKERLRSLRVHCSLRSLRLALLSRCLPHSLADEKRVCSLTRPGQRRASLAQHGGPRFPDARSSSCRLVVQAPGYPSPRMEGRLRLAIERLTPRGPAEQLRFRKARSSASSAHAQHGRHAFRNDQSV